MSLYEVIPNGASAVTIIATKLHSYNVSPCTEYFYSNFVLIENSSQLRLYSSMVAKGIWDTTPLGTNLKSFIHKFIVDSTDLICTNITSPILQPTVGSTPITVVNYPEDPFYSTDSRTLIPDSVTIKNVKSIDLRSVYKHPSGCTHQI